MPTRYFAPNGPDAAQIGGIIDDHGQRFMVMRFSDGSDQAVAVAMPIPTFQAFAETIGRAARASATRTFWKTVPRG